MVRLQYRRLVRQSTDPSTIGICTAWWGFVTGGIRICVLFTISVMFSFNVSDYRSNCYKVRAAWSWARRKMLGVYDRPW